MVNILLLITTVIPFLTCLLVAISWWRQTQRHCQLLELHQQLHHHSHTLASTIIRLDERANHHQTLADSVVRLLEDQQRAQHHLRSQFDEHQMNSLKTLQESLHNGMTHVRQQVTEALSQNADALNQRVDKLTQATDARLQEISGRVEQRLADGFEKTTTIFMDVIKRLALIDEAQKKITELSGNVVSLQEILADKRSRGIFGEVQLLALVRNVLPEQSFAFQHTLSNGKRADCVLFLPEPTGNLVIDAKFPLESYRQIHDNRLTESERRSTEQTFRRDIRKHIQDIAEKYIIPQETSDGAMMFIPAEAVFAEIHGHYPDLVEIAQKARVWMVSPTTMMAILTTARAALKDAATRQQVHIIQEHLGMLSQDFQRFQKRMDKLASHIKLAHEDAEEVHTSSKKITQRFLRIEKVELSEIKSPKEKAALVD